MISRLVVAFACLVVSGSDLAADEHSSSGEQRETVSPEVGRQDGFDEEFCQPLKRAAPAKPLRVALIGDSTVASYPNPPADRPDLTGWGQVFGEFFTEQVVVLNHARSGRSSKSFVREGLWKKTLESKPDYVLIQFGHNDQPGKGDRTTDPQGDFQDYLRQYIREARAVKAKPILVTPVARRTFQGSKATSSLGPWAEAMKEVGRQQRVPVIDLHADSLRLFDQLGDTASADFSPSKTDRTHFSRHGALKIAALVVAALPAADPVLASHLKTLQK